jgi:DNA repair protein RecO (recombination protein O)
MGTRRRATRSHETLALVLRRTPYGESDLVVSLFTQTLGQVAALARAARKSQRRFGGNLEPLHTIAVSFDEAQGSELFRLNDARIERPRIRLLENLDGMEAAGRFLVWIRHAAPEHTPEPLLWDLAQSCLDELDAGTARSAALTLASHGLPLLVACGWRLELEHCVQSGVRCPDGKAAMIDPERGGLVSRARGGASVSVGGAARQRLIAAQAGDLTALLESDAPLALELVERCLRAHAGLLD